MGRYKMIQASEDATAESIGDSDILAQMEDWVRSMYRTGRLDRDTYETLMADIYRVRVRVAGHRDELARIRAGGK